MTPATAPNPPALLAVDWGTSSLRAALLDERGGVLDQHASARGLVAIPAGGWAAAFDAEFGGWMARWPGLLCLMSGMVGSRQGWAEVPYCAAPADLVDLVRGLLWLQPGRLAIVPGVSVQAAHVDCAAPADDTLRAVPDVMRGEETQVMGALALQGLSDATLVLPGTHSKWVTVHGGRISDLRTAMTGECYALLRRQSILARGLPEAEPPLHAAAFDLGVQRARAPGGLLHHLFGVRTLALFERLCAADLASYLSGLVIGEEMRAQLQAVAAPGGIHRPVLLVGDDALTARYQRALGLWGVAATRIGAEAGWRGLWALRRSMAM